MKAAEPFLTSKFNKILLGVTVVGLFISSLSILYYLPINPFQAEQCPDRYSQEQIDASNCIVGADLSGAAFLFIGGPILLIGAAALAASLLLSRFHVKLSDSWGLLKFGLLAVILFFMFIFALNATYFNDDSDLDYGPPLEPDY